MALDTRLTILDYLGIKRNSDVWKQSVDRLSGNHFGSILSTCLSEQKETGLTASDYLANPVKLTSENILVLPDYIKELNSGGAGKSLSRMQAAVASEYSQQLETEAEDGLIRKEIEQSIQKASEKYDLPYEFIKGVIRAESNFQVRAESPAGAQGLMQLMPNTAKELGVTDPFDIDQNIDAGTRYLKEMMNRFDNDPEKALSAYNAGPATVERYGGKVPYKETKQYVARVLDFAGITV